MIKLSESQKKDVKNCLQEISNSWTRTEAERDQIKAIVDRMEEEFEIPKKLARRLARVFHKRSIAEEIAAANELNDVYDDIIAPSDLDNR